MNADPREEQRPTEHGSGGRLWFAVVLSVLVLAVLLRIFRLDADPNYPVWAGYVVDEGRWTEQARAFVLFGMAAPANDLARMHLFLAPLYQAVTALSFSALGVGLSSARLVSAVSSIILLLAAFLFLRRRLTRLSLLIVLVVLAVQPDVLLLSRVAIPEMAAMLFSFLAFATLLTAAESRWRMAGAGLLTLVAVGFKATVAPLVPIFAAAAWLTGRAGEPRARAARAATFLAGSVVPAALGLGLLLLAGARELPMRLAPIWHTLSPFLEPDSPYGAVAEFFYGDLAPSLAPLFLAMWLIASLLLAVGRIAPGPAREVWIGSAVWVGGWLLVSSVLDYFPERYLVHVLLPVTLNIGSGLTLLQRVGRDGIVASLRDLTGRRRALVAVSISLPAAVILTPVLIDVAQLAGLTLERLRQHLAMIAVLTVVLAGAWVRWWRPGLLLPLMVALPLGAVGLLMAVDSTGLLQPAFWSPGGFDQLLGWGALFLASGLIAALPRDRGPGAIRVAAALYLSVISVVWLARSGRPLLSPTYTIRDAGPVIEETLRTEQPVGSVSAAALFLETDLRYVEVFLHDSLPSSLVVALRPIDPALAERYRLERELDLELGEDLVRRKSLLATVRVYRRHANGGAH